MTQAAGTDTQRIPTRYWVWLFGAAISLLGDLTMSFAIGWSASHYGGRTAGTVLLLAVAPRAALLLIGGAIGDRFGAHRVMLISCVAMFLLTSALVPTTLAKGEPVGLLLGIALAVGVIDAFFLPSSRAMPRLLVPTEQIPRALASYQVVGVVFAISGTALGGAIVGWKGFPAAAAFDAATFAIVIVVLILIRGGMPAGVERTTGMLRSIADGVRMAFGRPLSRSLLIVMTLAAGLLMPLDALLLPLLARDHQWTATTAGMLIAGRSVGVGVIALRILAKGAFPRPGMFACFGLLLAGGGLFGLSAAPSIPLAVAAAVVSGAGTGLFTGHVLPLLMNSVDRTYQSRLQSVIVLCQSLALVVMNPVLGTLSDVSAIGITGVCVGIGVTSALIGLIALTRPVLRNATV